MITKDEKLVIWFCLLYKREITESLYLNINYKRINFQELEMIPQISRLTDQTHEEIAKNTGSAREVVTRMLNYFASEKIVVLSRGSITVINEHKLREIAGDYQEL